MTVDELLESGYEHIEKVEGSLVLKQSSPYFNQVQGEMAIKGCNMCHFVLWTWKEFEIISVPFDSDYWNTILLPKLLSFFHTFVKPALLKS